MHAVGSKGEIYGPSLQNVITDKSSVSPPAHSMQRVILEKYRLWTKLIKTNVATEGERSRMRSKVFPSPPDAKSLLCLLTLHICGLSRYACCISADCLNLYNTS